MSPVAQRLDSTLGHWAARFSWASRGAMERRLKPYALTPPMMAALLLVDAGCERGADLAREMGVDAAAVTRLLDRLANDGWLKRSEMEGDRRCHLLHLSKKALDLVPKLQSLAVKMEQELGKAMSVGEKELLIRQLKALSEAAEKL
jgi:MarR family transcriptional regulator for hemolysin